MDVCVVLNGSFKNALGNASPRWFLDDVLISGEELNKYYFMILVPLGVAGNILSFAVS